MAGMYPDDKEVEIYGEKVTFPGLDAEGKYSNGDFTDPAVKPSFFDAATTNLVLDNLTELIKLLGGTPNNKDGDQLAKLFTHLATQNKAVKRDSFGRAKVAVPVANDDIAVLETVKGNISDATTLSPKTHGAVRLTADISSSNRTLSNGVFVGQEFIIINGSGKSINFTTTGGDFTVATSRFYTKLVWSGTVWYRGMEIPIGALFWFDTMIDPRDEFGGSWEKTASSNRALVTAQSTIGNVSGKVPNITGQINNSFRRYQNTPSEDDSALYYILDGYQYTTIGGGTPNYVGSVGLDLSRNNQKYSGSLVTPDGIYVIGWRKTGF